MTHRKLIRCLAAAAGLVAGLALSAGEATAQFGRFGRNKVIYKTFDWKVYKSPHFDVYYYPEEEMFLEQIVSYAESSYLYLKEALDHEPKFRIPLIYYKNHGDFEQTNIDLDFIPESVGAFADRIEKRMVLPVDHPPDALYELLTHELTHIFEYSILFEDSAGRALRAGTPLWLMEGLSSFMAKDESSFDRMAIRDAVVGNLVPDIGQVRNVYYLQYRIGHAVFDFIEQEFGLEGVRSFLNEYRKVLLSGNIEKAIKETFGIEGEEFNRRFMRYLHKRYIPVLLENKEPEDHGKEIGFKLPGIHTFSPTLSPSGDLVAVMTNRKDDLDVVILNAKDGEMIRNLTKGLTTEYDYLVAEVFNGKNDLSWSPGGDEVAVFARSGNRRHLLLYNAVTGKEVLNEVMDVDEAESPAFSPDGKRIAFAGNKNGQVDIFEYHLENKTLANITNDAFFDSNPAWSEDGKTILYNRRINAYEKVFLLDYEDPAQKTQVTFGETSDIQPAFSRDGKRVYYASDAGEHDIFNIYSLDLETGEVRQYTDVVSGHFSPRELPELEGKRRLVTSAYWGGRYRLYTVDLDKPVEVTPPEARVQEPAEIEPFKPSLQLTVDEAEKKDYAKREYHLEAAPEAIGVGVANDGTIIGNAYLTFSDLLGDHRFWVNTYSIGSFTNFDAGYIDLKRRFQWYGAVSDYRDFVVLPTSSGRFVREQANRSTSLRAGMAFPFSTYSRVQATVGVANRDVISTDFQTFATDPAADPNVPEATFGFLDFDTESGTSPFASVSLINDTTRFREFGPWHGKRVNLTVTSFPYSSGDLGTYLEYSLDARLYQKVTRRSLLAFRLFADISEGEGAQFFSIGGYNQIRGFQYREFLGDRAAFANLELRFPLVDELRLPFGSIRSIRGLAFFDVGTAWTQGGFFWDKETGLFRDFKFYDSDENRLRDGRASYGLGFSFRLGYLDLNWTFAKRLPFTETRFAGSCLAAANTATTFEELAAALASCPLVEVSDDAWRSDFYIGYSF
ncbi:MAG TPA: hypothetical protein VJV23_01365 [Candidatus Polarisedimenticolia bacterium]|nr:hypothetical protein [Candidatus Polarisedimenticolia bacterium]